MLITGQLFHDRYMVLREIAEGGQSTVYMAQDKGAFDRLVAIKEFKLTSVALNELPNAIQQFGQTASMLAHLNHANIAQIYEYITIGNVPYLVTEYILGGTLEQYLRSYPLGLPEFQVKQWAMQLCDVLGFLHAQVPPIIFRDLKPDNIMIAPNGMLKLIDFGIARTFKIGRSGDTEALGTPGFAPPEQYGQGQSQTGPYTDVYALGVTLLRLATGYEPNLTPFNMPRADKVKPDISRDFANVIETATRPDFRQRYQTMAAFQKALTSPGKKATPAPKIPIAAAVISAVLLLVLAAVAAFAMGLLPASLSPSAIIAGISPATATVTTAASVTPNPTETATQVPDTPAPTSTALPAADATMTASAEKTSIAGEVWKTATAISAATRAASGTETPQPPTATPVPAGTSALPATATSAATPTTSGGGSSGKGTNALFSFEQAFAWKRGDQPYGDLTYSTEQAHDGTGSAKLSYNIPDVANHFVVFINQTTLPGQATGMVAWVFGDGSGHFLNTWITDAAGQVRQFTFGRITYTGWRQVVAMFDTSAPWPQSHISGPDSQSLSYPVSFYAFVLDRAGGSGNGAIYIDEVNYTTQALPSQPVPAATNPAPAAGTATVTNVPPPSGQASPCNASMARISNFCVGSNPVKKGTSTFAIWRIETTFKEGCLDKGDGNGCLGPISQEMQVDLGIFNATRTIVLSWLDNSNVRRTDQITVQVQ